MASRKPLAYYARRCWGVLLIALLAVSVITAAAYHRTETTIGANHAIVFFYRANVPGTYAEHWAQEYLRTAFPETEYFEVQCFQPGVAGTVSAQDSGWYIILARLAAREGDILVLDRERYDFLRQNGYLSPLNGLPGVRAVAAERLQADGETVFGVRADGLSLPGLTFPGGDALAGADANELIVCLYQAHSAASEAVLSGLLAGAREEAAP